MHMEKYFVDNEEVRPENADPTTMFNFEATRICDECGTLKTLTYFGRMSLQEWGRTLLSEVAKPYMCEVCSGPTNRAAN